LDVGKLLRHQINSDKNCSENPKYKVQKLKEALKYFQKALEIYPSDESANDKHDEILRSLFALKEFDIDGWKKAAIRRPENQEVWFFLGKSQAIEYPGFFWV
jgi:tetratricopeptide (TPR) repeat protein